MSQAPIEVSFPLYPLQEVMLFECIHSGVAGMNVSYATVELREDLDVKLFEEAWQRAIDQYPALRSAFRWVDIEEPRIEVHASAKLVARREDWRALPEAEKERLWRELIDAERKQGLDMAKAPLMRVVSVLYAPGLSRVVWIIDHTIMDGLAMNVVMWQVLEAYGALRKGEPVKMKAFPDQGDLVEWLRKVDVDKSRDFWKTRLANIQEPTRFGIDKPDAKAVPSSVAYPNVTRKLPEGFSGAVKEWARANGLTLNTVSLAAWSLLLSRHSGQREVVFGALRSARRKSFEQAELQIGCVINSVAFAVDVNPDQNVREWLTGVRKRWIDIHEHEYTPLTQIKEWSGFDGRQPLFESLFCYDHIDFKAGLRNFGLQRDDVEVEEFAQPNVPVSVNMYGGSKIVVRIVYDPNRIAAESIERLQDQFETALASMMASIDKCVRDLSILPEKERKFLLETYAGRSRAFPVDTTIHGVFEAQASRTPNARALTCEGTHLTYAELDARANQLAHVLRGMGVGPDVLVGLCLERGIDLVIGVLGILKAGGAYVPLDLANPAERIALILEDSQVPVLVTESALLEKLPVVAAKVVNMDRDRASLDRAPLTRPAPSAEPSNLAYVIYTSGSTGKPKGVMIEHRHVVRLFTSTQELYKFGTEDVWTLFHSSAFDFSVWEIWGALFYGGRLVVVPYLTSRSPEKFLALLTREKVTVLNQTPSAFKALIEADGRAGVKTELGLKWVIFGGEALDLQSLGPWFARHGDVKPTLVNMYGITETTVHVTWRTIRQSDLTAPIGSVIGPPIPDLQVYVLDPHGQLTPVGVPGEMYVGGAGVARGYLRRPELTAERFVADRFSPEPGARLYRSGDGARTTSTGELIFLGRLDNQVKIRGFRIELGEIEAAVKEMPGIQDALVITREDTPGDTRLVAYAVPSQGSVIAVDALRTRLRERLPDYMVPSAFVLLERMPLSPNGKINRRQLPAPQAWLGLDKYTAPRNPTEAGVAEICADLLKVTRVGAHDDFFTLGGHSLLATRLIARIRKQYQVELQFHHLFERPTVAGIAETIEEERSQGRPVVPPLVKRADASLDAPVSFAQGDLWFLDQVGAGAAYNMQLLLRLTGPLDVACLERSIEAIVARHAALRTRFAVVDGTPRQAVEKSVAFPLTVHDRTSVKPTQRLTAIHELAARDAEAPFDLARGPLFRASLVRLADDDHALVFTLHHVISDAWSLAILQTEIASHYKAFAARQEVDLPSLPIQYTDFAAWQRDWLRGDVLDTQLEYWKGKLGDGLPLLNLPADRPRPLTRTFRGASSSFIVRGAELEALRRLAREQGVTMAMLLLAAYQTVLSRYTGQDDIVLGSPIANRRQTETENLIGFFVNTLVLRSDLSGDPTFTELLGRVRKASLEAYDNQDVPLEKIVDALVPVRDLARPPLFQATFAMQNVPSMHVDVPGLTIAPLTPEYATIRFDLELYIGESKDGLTGDLYYSTALFGAPFAQALVGHLQTALREICQDPNRPISELPLLSEVETRTLLADWNATSTAYPRDRSVPELFERQVERTPDAMAVRFGGQHLTYAQLNRRANQLAHELRGQGVQPGHLVGVCMERGLDFVVCLTAILKAGAAYVPMDSDYPAQRLATMLADAKPRILLTHAALTEHLPPFDGKLLCVDAEAAKIAARSDVNLGIPVKAIDLAYVIYTSGSTGKPKGVQVPHRAIVRLVVNTDYVKILPDDGVAQASNASFDAATFEIWGALVNGAVLVGVPKSVLLAPPALAEQIRLDKITILFVTTALFNQLSLGAPGIFAPLRTLCFGGEAVDPARVRAVLDEGPPRRLLHVYGPTESTTFSTWHEVKDVAADARTVPIGRPIANTTYFVLDAHMKPVPLGAPGELYLGGDGVALGYLHDPDLTARKFVRDPFVKSADARLYRTGDVVRMRRDGALEFVGRTDHQVKLRGFRIELGEIESALGSLDDVRDAVVLCREDVPGDKRLVAYIVPDRRGSASDETDVLGQWRALYDGLYTMPSPGGDVNGDPTFNLAGWVSSYTGKPFPAGEMQEWLDETLECVLASKPKRILQIGVGAGLLLFRAAPRVAEFVGTDFSEKAIEYVRQQLTQDLKSKVKLHHRLPADLEGIPRQHFDVVVLDSIVHYFPSIDYLLRCVTAAVDCTVKGGRVVIGDVRNHRLLGAFQASVDAHRAAPETRAGDLTRQVQQHLLQEEELTVDPAFFLALARHVPRITHVEIEPKRGASRNELTEFRYGAVLHVESPAVKLDGVRWVDWSEELFDMTKFRALLTQSEGAPVGVRRIPNGRSRLDAEFAAELGRADAQEPVSAIRERLAREPRCQGIDPARLCQLAKESGLRVLLSWADSTSSGDFDALFLPASAAAGARFPMPSVKAQPWDAYGNRPIQAQWTRRLVPRLREALSTSLPEYMMPSAFVMLDAMPLNANGKVNRAVLPRPDAHESPGEDRYVPPRTPTEERVAKIWAELLGVERVGVNSNFFALGGHSLMAMRVITRLKNDTGLDIPLQSLFDAPTVTGLAERVDTIQWAKGGPDGSVSLDGPLDGSLDNRDVVDF